MRFRFVGGAGKYAEGSRPAGPLDSGPPYPVGDATGAWC